MGNLSYRQWPPPCRLTKVKTLLLPKKKRTLDSHSSSKVKSGKKVSVVAETVNVTGQTSAQQFKVPPCRLSEDLSALFESKQFSDCTLVANCKSTGPQTFYVHKAILAARSRVFHAMFEHNMTESERNEVAIDDVEPDVSGLRLLFFLALCYPHCKFTKFFFAVFHGY
ncbi:BTB/POZ domain protein [Oesophagostomum dentatum]|uniref:BTB/POZ domain protein n=1 Tax=Oesophagostomum dentatum TaxID=61180 RepID=A0A0B1SUE3_OESDE|nr:BTB/POZ domain protein [Oesophagostomum dentatum]